MRSFAALCGCCLALTAAELPKWAPFIEPNFPFFSSALTVTNDITPRGLVLNVGPDVHVCFDVDLLRVSAIWRGPGVTPVSMSQGSYENQKWGKKAPEGQELLPRIIGDPWLVTGPFSSLESKTDPREPGPDPKEFGRGPLPAQLGQFKAISFGKKGVFLEYELEGALIRDRYQINTRTQTLDLESQGRTLQIHPAPGLSAPPTPNGKRWPDVLQTSPSRISTNDAYRIEHIALPISNPWRRNVRLADIAFFSNGRAAAVTFDGDIWLIDGLSDDLKNVKWRRFTSGLHEPQSLAIKKNQIYVFDRNGIWKILDTDGDGEADRHEMFCNRFTQTAETREFASSMKLAPDGSFIIGKPGQTGSTVGRDSGKILRISADGKTVTPLGHGFRQPFLGINPRTGLVTASDQQGHYIPSTPLQIIRDNLYYGFRPVILPREETPPKIAEPLVWIPHAINASAAGQVWAGKGMGPLNNTLLHLGYYRSEIFSVLWDGGPNAAVISFTRDLQFAPLSAAVHPKDGTLFVTGFQLWGASAPEISGLARISYIGGPSAFPRKMLPFREGALISFHLPVNASSIRPENFSAERWNYRRSHEYGSPHFKPDGSKGQETIFASSVYLSKDRKSVFVAFPDMQPVMQMRLGWSLAAENGLSLQHNAYLTPRQLETFGPAARGFGKIKIDLTPRVANQNIAENAVVTAEEGHRLADLMGCAACHSSDGSTLGKVGPTWKGLAGSRVQFADRTVAVADTDYLRESIRQPAAKIVKDFDKSDAGMPSYEGVLTDPQIEALILYIQSLK